MKRAATVILLIGLLLPAACRRQVQVKEQVRAFIKNTQRLPRSLEYSSNESDLGFMVKGRVEDSFRYQGTVETKGKEILQWVIDDDAFAVKILDPQTFAALAPAAAPTSTVIQGALLGGQWVVDPSGAPTRSKNQLGRTGNPLQDSADVMDYLILSIDEAQEVKLWQEEDLEPAYFASEDHFPPPDDAVGERRFDLVRTGIPRPSQQAAGGVEQLPRTSMFRKMALYVRGNRLVRALEDIDVDGHHDFVDAKKKHKKRMLDLLDAIHNLRGSEGIRPRKMTARFFDLGEAATIRAPQDALKASLRGIFFSPVPAGGGTGGGETGGGQTSTEPTPNAPEGTQPTQAPAEPNPQASSVPPSG
jgi:hypothetical protein